jgi:hypothetical protein
LPLRLAPGSIFASATTGRPSIGFLDSAHARLVEYLAALLRRCGWEVVIEATFWIRGERGSVDLLAWHPGRQVVLIVEVKFVVPDVQAMLAAIDRKRRLGLLIARERGWNAIAVATLLVIGESRTSRRRVDAHAATFQQAFPHRAIEVRRWLAAPGSAPLHGLWFWSASQAVPSRHRVARPATRLRAQGVRPRVLGLGHGVM